MSVRISRPSARSTSSSAWPVSRICAVGKPFELVTSVMVGSLASIGSSARALFWISRRKSLMRLSNTLVGTSSNRTRMPAMLSRAADEMKRMSDTFLIASSSGCSTRFSTSSGEAPGSTTVICTQLKLISGSCSRGRPR
jgi:hypothetical protein